MGVDIRFATMDDAERINDFHNQYYGIKRTFEQWKWEFASYPEKDQVVPFVVADDAGRIVGSQAMIPITMIDKQGSFLTAKSEAPLVDPEYCNRLLLVRMHHQLIEYAESNNITSIWGLSVVSDIVWRLVGFEIAGIRQQLFRPLHRTSVSQILERQSELDKRSRPRLLRWLGAPLSGAATTAVSLAIAIVRGRRPRIAGLTLETLTVPPEDGHRLTALFVKQWGGATILRDREYLRWRIFDNKHTRATMRAAYLHGRMVGWVAYSVDVDRVGYIVDSMVGLEDKDQHLAEGVIQVLLGDVIECVRKTGAVAIRAWHVNAHPYDQALFRAASSFGFFRLDRGGDMSVYPPPAATKRASLKGFDHWYISRLYTEGLQG